MVAIDQTTWIEGAEGRWRMGLRAPMSHLAGCVNALTWYDEESTGPVSRRQAASSGAVLFVTWRSPLEVRLAGTSRSLWAFVAGVQDRPASTAHSGSQQGIGVHLNALGVSRLLSMPGAELANRCVGLDEVWGHTAERLLDELSAATTPNGRMSLVQRALTERLGSGPNPAPEVVWVWQKLLAQPGAPIADLAAEVGWSRTRLASRFSEQVGVSPKRFARIVRFERARQLLAHASFSLAEVATGCGYYDQPHLNRDVLALAGCTPAQLADELTSGDIPDP